MKDKTLVSEKQDKSFIIPKEDFLKELFNTEVYKEIYHGWDCDPCP